MWADQSWETENMWVNHYFSCFWAYLCMQGGTLAENKIELTRWCGPWLVVVNRQSSEIEKSNVSSPSGEVTPHASSRGESQGCWSNRTLVLLTPVFLMHISTDSWYICFDSSIICCIVWLFSNGFPDLLVHSCVYPGINMFPLGYFLFQQIITCGYTSTSAYIAVLSHAKMLAFSLRNKHSENRNIDDITFLI